MARSRLFAAALTATILNAGILSAGAALADPETDQLREQLRATVLQLRQLQDQQASAPAPAAAPTPDAAGKARLASLQAQLRAARQGAAKASRLQSDLDGLQAQNAALIAAASASSAQLESIKTAYAQSVESGRAVAAERDRLKADLTRMTTIATACQTKNTRLTAFTESVLDAYNRVGLGQVLGRREPFLGLKRVQLENIAQDREDIVRGDRCDPHLDAAGPARAG